MNIVIPTYDRSDRFKTIQFLKANDIPNEWITIFLANEEEKVKYLSIIGENGYKWVVGEKGICNQRNFITDYFEENEYIISMDDDIIDIIHKDNRPFKDWVNDCLNYMKETNLGLLTISPSSNPYFFKMKNKDISFRRGNYLAVGVFHIYKNHKDIKMELDFIEDYERSVLYLKKYGENIRYYDVLLKTKYWGKGGLTEARKADKYITNVNKMMEKYPNYFKVNYKKIPQLSKTEKLPNLSLKKN